MKNIKKTKQSETPKKTPDDSVDRQKPTPYHNAAFNVLCYRLRQYIENGDIELIDEYQLSKAPLKIDFMIVKKKNDIEPEPKWAKIFRKHNIIEYKSPAAKPLTLAVFNKTIGYANIYAAQEGVKISDVTVTLVCHRTPKKLFKTLKEDFDYDILQKDDGVYYIIQKGVIPEKSLAIQVAVQKSELLLQALDTKAPDGVTVDKVADFMRTDGKNNAEILGYWFKALSPKIIKNISERMGLDMYASEKAYLEVMESLGLSDRLRQEGLQKGRQEGLQKGRQEGAREVIALLEKGYSLTDAKKELLLT